MEYDESDILGLDKMKIKVLGRHNEAGNQRNEIGGGQNMEMGKGEIGPVANFLLLVWNLGTC